MYIARLIQITNIYFLPIQIDLEVIEKSTINVVRALVIEFIVLLELDIDLHILGATKKLWKPV